MISLSNIISVSILSLYFMITNACYDKYICDYKLMQQLQHYWFSYTINNKVRQDTQYKLNEN